MEKRGRDSGGAVAFFFLFWKRRLPRQAENLIVIPVPRSPRTLGFSLHCSHCESHNS